MKYQNGNMPEPYYGDRWYDYDLPSERWVTLARACRAWGQQWGDIAAKDRYKTSDGYTNHHWKYHDCESNYNIQVYATHPNGTVQGATYFLGVETLTGQCLPFDEDRAPGQQCTHAGNPIDLATGNKYQAEVDYRSPDGKLEFTRHYNSRPANPAVLDPSTSALGRHWRSTYDRAIRRADYSSKAAHAYRPDGKVIAFHKPSGSFISTPDVIDQLQERFAADGVFIGWQYRVGLTDEVELYGVAGELQSITTRAGEVTSMSYDVHGRLSTVTDPFGKVLTLSYDSSGRLSTLTTPGGQLFVYAYDAFDNLVSVTAPDGYSRSYLYNEPAHTGGAPGIHAMTGLVDENGARFATFRYNAAGQAVSTEHAGGVVRYEITSLSSPAGGTTSFIDPQGKSRTIGLATVKGVPQVTSSSEYSELSCARHKSAKYDYYGDLIESVDFNDVKTTRVMYTGSRKLERYRTEADGVTGLSRRINTTWHDTYRLPLVITNGGLQTTYTYDAAGNVLTRTLRDTGAVTTSTRSWTYTYNTFGQVLTEDGPRTDVADVTTYTYYECTNGGECGQLHTVTNALGHTTTYEAYNAHGQPLTILDANAVTTTLAYDLRQRLISRTVGSEVTTFEYWPTGLTKKVTLPDATYLVYTYDAAHRLTSIRDDEGNRIEYTLDTSGNRIGEQAFDPSNALARSRTRVFDELNRLQQEIGAAGTASVTTTYGYDDNGNQTSIDSPLGRDSQVAYDALNRPIQRTDALGGVTSYGYNRLDHLISVTDPRGLVTSYVYNAVGELQRQTSPDTAVTQYTYDSGGNVATSKDARNATTTHTYDELNRVATSSFAAGTVTDRTLVYSYDAGTNGKGKLTGVADADHSMTWTYDQQGRVVSAEQTVAMVSKITSYVYADGRRQSMTTPSGQVVTYDYVNGNVATVN